MITVPEIVEEIVKRSPFLEEGLATRILNLSSLARKIQPEIQKKLLKDIRLGAIVMALKRLEAKLAYSKPKISPILDNLGDITVRSNLINFTYANSSTLLEKQFKLFESINEEKNNFITITDGLFETSIFVSTNIANKVEEIFEGEKLKSKLSNLSSITIIIPVEAIQIPGVYYSILKKLAWEGINFIEVVSSFTELTIFLEEKDINRAFAVLKS
jgi:aspartokinase